MAKSILVLSGPGLDRLGQIEQEQYGTATLADIRRACEIVGAAVGYDIDFRQTNDTGEALKWVTNAGDAHVGIVINPAISTRTDPQMEEAYAALTHALGYVKLPTVEVHLSNVFRHAETEYQTFFSPVSLGFISGLGAQGYELAIKALAHHLAAPSRRADDGPRSCGPSTRVHRGRRARSAP